MILEEVEVHEGDLFGTGVLDHGLDFGIADLTQSNVQGRCPIGPGRQGRDILGQGQQGSEIGSETHDAQISVARDKLLFL